MKAILLAVAITVFGKIAFTQTFSTYADTANYLMHEIEAKRTQYVGNAFSILFDSLKIKPVRIINAATSKADFGSRLLFEFNNQKSFSKAHFISITFENVSPYEVLYPILYPGVNVDRNNDTIINTYKPFIIKSFVIKDYSKDEDPDPGILFMKAPKKVK
mgnify:CR=1 FL=1